MSSVTSSRRGGLITNIYVTSIAMYCSLRLQSEYFLSYENFVSPEVCNCFIFSTCLISYSYFYIVPKGIIF